MLAALKASSAESARERVKSLIYSITVEADGRVVVGGTYEPLLLEETPVFVDAGRHRWKNAHDVYAGGPAHRVFFEFNRN